MTYSSGIFNNENDDLFTSQINKYDNIIKNLNIENSDTVLEVGSGWGGFIERNSQTVKSNIEGLTISEQQYNYIENLINDKK